MRCPLFPYFPDKQPAGSFAGLVTVAIILSRCVRPLGVGQEGREGPCRGTPLRVLHVYRTYFPDSQGGIEELIRQVCLYTKSCGIDNRLLALSANAEPRVLRHNEVKVYRARRDIEVASCGMSLQAFAMHQRLAEWADLIHYHFPWPFGDLLHLTSRVKRPTVLTYHSDIVRQRVLRLPYRPVMHRFLRSVDRIVGTSPNYFATSDVLRRFRDKVEIVPIGLNEHTYPDVSAGIRTEMRGKYGEDFFLFIGVLRYYKGLHILLDACANAPFRVVIAGSGPTERELLDQARRLRLDNVTFTGYVSNEQKVALLSLCRGVVFPSYLRAEAFGVALLEGAMHSKALISTEAGSGTSHVNIGGETGLVVAPGSAPALRQAMDRIHDDAELADAMGRRARQRFEQLFTGDLMGERYNAIYRSLGREALAAEVASRQRSNGAPV